MEKTAKKSLGQNFLIDPNYKEKIKRAVESVNPENIIEIGPGRGALTDLLVPLAKKVVLIEKDNSLVTELQEKYKDQDQVKIYHSDILDFDFSNLETGPWTVVGNLPYNISSQILIKLYENKSHFSHFFVMFQKEMALRITGKICTKDYGPLAVWTALFSSSAKKVCDLPPSVFRPRPRVKSRFLHIALNDVPFEGRSEAFLKFIRMAFAQRRKKLGRLFKGHDSTDPRFLKILDQRPEQLPVSELSYLFDHQHLMKK